MDTSINLTKYTAEQINEIIDRIIALRMRCLRHVETGLVAAKAPVFDR